MEKNSIPLGIEDKFNLKLLINKQKRDDILKN